MDGFTLDKIEFDAVRGILADFCRCSLGKGLAHRINPSRNPETIHHWLEQTTQMAAAIRDVGLPPFGGITDITECIHRARPGGEATGEDFAHIAAVLEGAGNVRAFLFALPEELTCLHELAGGMGDFTGEIKAVRSIVASDGTVMDSASERLAAIRREIATTTQHIHDVIYGYLRQPEVAKLLQNATVTLHGDRYVLPVKYTNRGRLPGVVHRESGSGQTVFVEPAASVELNNRLLDHREDERREISRLLGLLAIRLFGRAEEMLSTLHALAQTDLIAGKAQYAVQFDMACPIVEERSCLQFDQARHPLLDHRAWRDEKAGVSEDRRRRVVPIDVRLGSDFDILVITGSNTGGKTVTLKTVALLAIMAQCGMHIPARRGAKMPLFQDVFIDVGDEQSLEQSLSTFGAHMKRLKHILHKTGKTSLVLLDELGSGTDPDEGGAIGQAILDELRRVGCLGMVTTHLSVLKAYAMNHERVDNASVDFDTATLSPTYNLRVGTPGESHAITVARKLGLPHSITQAAQKHLSNQGKQFRRAIRATGEARQVAEAARAEAATAQFEAQGAQDIYEAKLADLHQLQGEFEVWLARLPSLRAGEELYVPSLKANGRLVRLELHQQRAVVDMGQVQVEVPLTELMPDLGQAQVREQIAAMHKQILDQARAAEAARDEAARLHDEYQKSLQQQKTRAKQFDQWIAAISLVKIGDVVPIARKPGAGTVATVDLPGLRATLSTSEGELTLPLQELFPQSGPFAPHEHHGAGVDMESPRVACFRAKRGKHESQEHASFEGSMPPASPLQRHSPDSKAALRSRKAMQNVKPGEQVFVVPFNKRATLIRINQERGLAVVQSGIFEMEIPLGDVEPV